MYYVRYTTFSVLYTTHNEQRYERWQSTICKSSLVPAIRAYGVWVPCTTYSVVQSTVERCVHTSTMSDELYMTYDGRLTAYGLRQMVNVIWNITFKWVQYTGMSWTKKTEIVDVVIVNSVMWAEGVGKGVKGVRVHGQNTGPPSKLEFFIIFQGVQ
jgi:hypothetical protein